MATRKQPYRNEGRTHELGGGGPTDGAISFDEGAWTIFKNMFESYGIVFDGELRGLIRGFILDGYTANDLNILMPQIQETQAFSKRFPGFKQRIANGYNAIDIPQYLQMENAYHRIMQSAGLPKGFYDDPSDFGKWIAQDVSVAEIESRVGLAVRAAEQVDPAMRNLMTRFYGLTTGDVASYFLDQKRALPVLDRQYKTAGVAAWAARYGLDASDATRYEDLVDKGITEDQAAQGYGTVAALKDYVGNVAGVYGETYGQSDAEQDVFFNNSEKRRRILSQEAATFGGSSSGQTGSAKRTSY